MQTARIEALRARTKQQILAYCADCNREIATLRASKDKLVARVAELERLQPAPLAAPEQPPSRSVD